MTIRHLTDEQYDDRTEWLAGAAGRELAEAMTRDALATIDALDRIKHAAQACAKHLRNQTGNPEQGGGDPRNGHTTTPPVRGLRGAEGSEIAGEGQ